MGLETSDVLKNRTSQRNLIMLKHWIEAARLRTLPLAFACIGMGGVLAAMEGKFDGMIFGMTLLTAFLLQVLSNFANDFGDSQNGADSVERTGPKRAVQAGKISPKAMRNAVIIFSVLSLASGIGLIAMGISSMKEFWIFLGMGVLSVIAAITYTMGNSPYGYMGLGDISVIIFFGLIAVVGTYYLQTSSLNPLVFLPAAACGLFATGVLNVNNIRDIESDKKAGKYSIPVRLGRQKAVYYHWFLLGAGWICAGVFVVMNYNHPLQLLFLLPLPLFIINARAALVKTTSESLDPFLKQLAISTLIFVVVFALAHLL